MDDMDLSYFSCVLVNEEGDSPIERINGEKGKSPNLLICQVFTFHEGFFAMNAKFNTVS